ncbi:hypothetical protein G6F35_018383 [Rhizopus arrhizus]|nr:hypothetical protein G6F35_018383 [Rhizopus arrhizus]KAG1472537.1 hypothetical protein G6F54_014432 [Rhizopus delemar]
MSFKSRTLEMLVSSLFKGKRPSDPRQASTVIATISSTRSAAGASARRCSGRRCTRRCQRVPSHHVEASTADSSSPACATG